MAHPEDLHTKAMALAHEAEAARDAGNEDQYLSLMKKALRNEIEAAKMLPKRADMEPTRAILFISAFSLAKEAGAHEDIIHYVDREAIHPSILAQHRSELLKLKGWAQERQREVALDSLKKSILDLRATLEARSSVQKRQINSRSKCKQFNTHFFQHG